MTDHPSGISEGGDADLGFDAAATTTGSSVLRGAMWNGVVRLLPPLYTLVQSVVAARHLGSEGMGTQSFIGFISHTAALALTGGLPIALLRSIGELRGRGQQEVLRGLLRWAWRIEAVAALLGGAFVLTFGLGRHELAGAWVLAAVACTAAILHTVPYSVLAGVQRWREAGIVGLTTGFLATIATVVVLEAGGGIVGMFAVEAAISIITLCGTTLLARRVTRDLDPNAYLPREVRQTVRWYAWLTTIQVLLATIVSQRSEFLFLDRYSTATQIALFSIPFGIVGAAARLPESLGGVFIPAVATLLGAGQTERIRTGYLRALRLLTIMTLPMTAGLLAAGQTLVDVAYGQDYDRASPVLTVMILSFPIIPLISVTIGVLEGLGRKGAVIATLAVGTIIDLVAAFVFVPGHGAIGAAFANTAAQVASAVIVLFIGARVLSPFTWQWRPIVRSAVAAVVGGFVIRVVIDGLGGGFLALVAGSLLGGACMAILAVVLRVLDEDDARWLAEAVAGRPWLASLVLRCFVRAPSEANING